MLFNSIAFFVFLFITIILLRISPREYQNILLTAVSWYFYSYWDVRFLSLIIISTLADYIIARAISRNQLDKRILLALSVGINLGILGAFKYYNFFSASIINLLSELGISISTNYINIILPVGISFYTFQTMGYTIDVYRGVCKARANFFDFSAYVAFFPQLVAGPIERADNLLPQLEEKLFSRKTDIISGSQLIIRGLCKKVLIADNLASLTEYVFDQRAPADTGLAILGVYAFAFQIYCDFSGYTDIARGVARLMGIDLMRNFHMPYIANSMSDFWRRWHISLSTWLRDYLYIPLGGNRSSSSRTRVNLIITMLLGGLWHGASWMFVIWGLYHGFLLVLERLFPIIRDNNKYRILRAIVVFHLVCLGWVFFRCKDLESLNHWMSMIISFHWSFNDALIFLTLLIYVSPIIVSWLIKLYNHERDYVEERILSPLIILGTVSAYLLLSVFSPDQGREFIYFQF